MLSDTSYSSSAITTVMTVFHPQLLNETTEIQEFRSALLRWGKDHYQDLPWRKPLPVWQGLVTEILLQRTRALQVVPVFEKFRNRYPTVQDFSNASRDEISELIKPLGLRWRAPLLYDLAQLINETSGQVPLDEKTLQQWPGVGPYVSSATLSLHANRRAVIIDSNVVRVLCRVVGQPYDGETRRKRWLRELTERLTPRAGSREYNYALLDLATAVCRPSEPLCGECPLESICLSSGEVKRSSAPLYDPG